MSGYEEGLPVSAIAFDKPPKMPNILGELVSAAGLTQFRCAETEKFPHVTFFFDDYREQSFPGTTRELIHLPSDVTTYDQKPEMSAHGVCEAVLRRLQAARLPAAHRGQLRQPRHGRPHRQTRRGHQGGGDGRCLRGPDREATLARVEAGGAGGR